MIRRPPRSTLSSSSAASDVYKRQVLTVMLVSAMTVPTNEEPDPSVAELVTCQKTLQDEAPLINLTWLPDPVMRVEAAVKIKTASCSPPASSVSVPVRPNVPPE